MFNKAGYFGILAGFLLCATSLLAKSIEQPKQDSLQAEQVLKAAFTVVYNNPDSCIQTISNYLKLHHVDDYFVCKALNYTGIAYDVKGQNDSALHVYKRALKIANRNNIVELQASINNNIGLIYWKSGAYKKAIDKYDISLKLFLTNKNVLGAANTLNNMGLIYQKMQRYDLCLKSYREATNLYNSIHHQRGLSAVFANLGAVQELLHARDSAKYFYQHALAIKTQIKDTYGMGVVSADFAKVYQKENQCDSAIYYNKLALEIFTQLDNKYHLAQVKYSIGKDFLCLQNLDSARYYFLAAEQLSINSNNLFTLKNIAEQLQNVYSLQGNWQKAFYASQQFNNYSDSLYSKEKAKAIFDVQEKYETEKKNREIAEKNASLAKAQLENSRKNLYLTLLLVGIFGLIVLFFYLVKQSRIKRQKLVREKELKTKEEKLRISKELHDNIGARLSHIISSLDVEIYKQTASAEIVSVNEFARETMRELRETIWAVSDKSIFLSELILRLQNYLHQVNQLAKIDIALTNQTWQDFELSTVQSINLFRVVQEALNNALKYSQATEINVLISQSENKIIVEIHDNGRGFDPKLAQKKGNGLKNMHVRAEEIKAQIKIESTAKKGSKIAITLAVN